MTTYYTVSGAPIVQSRGNSKQLRDEFPLIQSGFSSVNDAIAGGGTTLWVTGTTYVAGVFVYSPIDFQDYRRKTAGAGATDPSVDTTNWEFRKTSLVSEVPQNIQSVAYQLVLTDAGKHILHPSADTTARIWTIPANATVAFRLGTTITFVNQASAGVITLSITSDTMRLAVSGTTGSRTLAANGIATIVKLTSTEWIISGPGVT